MNATSFHRILFHYSEGQGTIDFLAVFSKFRCSLVVFGGGNQSFLVILGLRFFGEFEFFTFVQVGVGGGLSEGGDFHVSDHFVYDYFFWLFCFGAKFIFKKKEGRQRAHWILVFPLSWRPFFRDNQARRLRRFFAENQLARNSLKTFVMVIGESFSLDGTDSLN